jgi:hypothetical protein
MDDKKNYINSIYMVRDDLMRRSMDMQKNTQIIAVRCEGQRLIIILRATAREKGTIQRR